MESQGQSSLGMDERRAAALAVFASACTLSIAGFVVFSTEKKSRFVRFYALQGAALALSFLAGEMLMMGILLCLGLICQRYLGTDQWLVAELPVLLAAMLWFALPALFLLLWILLLTSANGGRIFHLPLLGRYCRRWVGL